MHTAVPTKDNGDLHHEIHELRKEVKAGKWWAKSFVFTQLVIFGLFSMAFVHLLPAIHDTVELVQQLKTVATKDNVETIHFVFDIATMVRSEEEPDLPPEQPRQYPKDQFAAQTEVEELEGERRRLQDQPTMADVKSQMTGEDKLRSKYQAKMTAKHLRKLIGVTPSIANFVDHWFLMYKKAVTGSIMEDMREFLRSDWTKVMEYVANMAKAMETVLANQDEIDMGEAEHHMRSVLSMIHAVADAGTNMAGFQSLSEVDPNYEPHHVMGPLPEILNWATHWIVTQLEIPDWAGLGADCEQFIDNLDNVDWSGQFYGGENCVGGESSSDSHDGHHSGSHDSHDSGSHDSYHSGSHDSHDSGSHDSYHSGSHDSHHSGSHDSGSHDSHDSNNHDSQDAYWDFECHGDDIAKLMDDTDGMVMGCSSPMCSEYAYTTEGAHKNWYNAVCCETCDWNGTGDNDDHSGSHDYDDSQDHSQDTGVRRRRLIFDETCEWGMRQWNFNEEIHTAWEHAGPVCRMFAALNHIDTRRLQGQ